MLNPVRNWFRDRKATPTQKRFRTEAEKRGVDAGLIRSLEPFALHLAPEYPEAVLLRRELFEQAGVTLLLANDGRDLSFSLAERLADTLEKLGLTRNGDLPDPLRRVRLVPHGGSPNLGIVLRPQGAEMLVLSSPRQRFQGRRGDGARLDLPGKNRLVEIPVRLTEIEERDQVRLIHIARPDGWGTLGRTHERFPVLLPLKMLDKAMQTEDPNWHEGEVFDLGEGGVCACLAERFPVGRRARLQVDLIDCVENSFEPFFAEARVVWARPEGPGQWRHGFAFDLVEDRDLERLRAYLSALYRPVEQIVSPRQTAS